MRYKPSMLLLALFYNAFSLQNKEKSIRHRSGVVPSPRWRISITAVMGWRHRGDGDIVYNPFVFEEALIEHFATHQYISARNYATLCHCSESTARRRIAQMLSEGKLMPSGIAKGLYKLKVEN